MPILPIVILAALALFALAAWSLFRALKGDRVSRRHAIVLLACCLALWLGLCLFFMIGAALGHSAHPLRDSWHQCAIGFVVLVVVPQAVFLWRAGRPRNRP